MSLHLESQKFATQKQTREFSSHLVEHQRREQGIALRNPILGFGVNHTEGQSIALEAIQKLFSSTHYRGNIDPLITCHSTIKILPRLRITQADYLKAYGVKENSPGSIERALNDLEELGQRQYFFRYERLSLSKTGMPEKRANGTYKKELVEVIDTLINLKKVYDSPAHTQQTSSCAPTRFKYYEIQPSPLLIDQIGLEDFDPYNKGNYFLLKSAGWREEIKLIAQQKTSKYIYQFINWLMVKFEEMRRTGNTKFVIQYEWQTIAETLKMAASTIKRNPKQAKKELVKACAIAHELEYLVSYDVETIAPLVLNPDKFAQPHICDAKIDSKTQKSC